MDISSFFFFLNILNLIFPNLTRGSLLLHLIKCIQSTAYIFLLCPVCVSHPAFQSNSMDSGSSCSSEKTKYYRSTEILRAQLEGRVYLMVLRKKGKVPYNCCRCITSAISLRTYSCLLENAPNLLSWALAGLTVVLLCIHLFFPLCVFLMGVGFSHLFPIE